MTPFPKHFGHWVAFVLGRIPLPAHIEHGNSPPSMISPLFPPNHGPSAFKSIVFQFMAFLLDDDQFWRYLKGTTSALTGTYCLILLSPQ